MKLRQIYHDSTLYGTGEWINHSETLFTVVNGKREGEEITRNALDLAFMRKAKNRIKMQEALKKIRNKKKHV